MLYVIRVFAIAAVAVTLAMPAASAIAEDKTEKLPVAYSPEEMIDLTGRGKRFTVASEKAWLQMDTHLAKYRLKTGKTHEELMKSDQRYREIVAHSLKARKRFWNTAQTIMKTRMDIDAKRKEMIEEYRKAEADFKHSFASVYQQISKLEDMLESRRRFSDLRTSFKLLPDMMTPSDCAYGLNEYLELRDYLLSNYGDIEAKVLAGQESTEITASSLDSIIATIDLMISNFARRDETARYILEEDHPEALEFCMKVRRKIPEDAKRLLNRLLAMSRNIVHIDKILTKEAKAFLEE